MAGKTALYTPEVLALSVQLAAYPLGPATVPQVTVRSRSCGSALTLGLALDESGRIVAVGLRAQACAIGQAAAAIFADAAHGRDAGAIAAARRDIAAWLKGETGLPDWPGLAHIEAARAYPGRHSAILLAWDAARQLLPTGAQCR